MSGGNRHVGGHIQSQTTRWRAAPPNVPSSRGAVAAQCVAQDTYSQSYVQNPFAAQHLSDTGAALDAFGSARASARGSAPTPVSGAVGTVPSNYLTSHAYMGRNSYAVGTSTSTASAGRLHSGGASVVHNGVFGDPSVVAHTNASLTYIPFASGRAEQTKLVPFNDLVPGRTSPKEAVPTSTSAAAAAVSGAPSRATISPHLQPTMSSATSTQPPNPHSAKSTPMHVSGRSLTPPDAPSSRPVPPPKTHSTKAVATSASIETRNEAASVPPPKSSAIGASATKRAAADSAESEHRSKRRRLDDASADNDDRTEDDDRHGGGNDDEMSHSSRGSTKRRRKRKRLFSPPKSPPRKEARASSASKSAEDPKIKTKRGSHFNKQITEPLVEWLAEHETNPYPTVTDREVLMEKTGLTRTQILQWFTNARRRLLKDTKKGRCAKKLREIKERKKVVEGQDGSATTSLNEPSRKESNGAVGLSGAANAAVAAARARGAAASAPAESMGAGDANSTVIRIRVPMRAVSAERLPTSAAASGGGGGGGRGRDGGGGGTGARARSSKRSLALGAAKLDREHSFESLRMVSTEELGGAGFSVSLVYNDWERRRAENLSARVLGTPVRGAAPPMLDMTYSPTFAVAAAAHSLLHLAAPPAQTNATDGTPPNAADASATPTASSRFYEHFHA